MTPSCLESERSAPAGWPGTGYVDGKHLLEIATFAGRLKGRLDALLKPRPGQRLLDVGCGPGADTLRLAAAVWPGGLVAGVDIDPQMVGLASGRAASSPYAGRVTHAAGDAARLPYPSGIFDGCRCERVLQHVTDASLAVAEMARVTRAGGVVVAADSDWASLSIHAADLHLERRIVGAVAESFRNGYAGRQLRDLFAGAGLQGVATELWPVQWTSYAQFRATSFMSAGIHRRLVSDKTIGLDEWDRFASALEAADARGGFLASAVVVIVAGVKSVTGNPVL